MRKKLLSNVMLLLTMLFVGVGSAWAQADKSEDYTGNVTLSSTGGSNASACKVIINETEYDGIKAGTSSKDGSVVITVPQGTKYLHLHIAGWNNVSVKVSVNPYSGIISDGLESGSISLTSNSGISGNSPFTFNGEANTSDYYKVLTFESALAENKEFTFKATSGKRFAVWGVTAEAESTTPGDQSVATTVTIDDSGITNTNVFDGTAAGSLAATVSTADGEISGATVAWSGNNDAVATIDANGAVTLVAAGTVNFKAEYAGEDGVYKSSSKTYTMTVTNQDPNAPGTKNNPYSVAEAIDAIDNNGNVTGVYVEGYISQIDSYSNSKYITYWISEDGTTTATQFEVYKGLGLNGADFSSKDDLAVGAKVVIVGNITYYSNSSVYEFSANSQLVSLELPQIQQQDPTITVADATIAFGETFTVDETAITGGAITVSGDEQIVSIKGLVITPKAAGKVVITVATGENTYYYAGQETFTLTITAPEGLTEAPAAAGETVEFDFASNDDWGLPEGSSNKTVDEASYSNGTYTIKVAGSTNNGYYWNTSGYLLMGKSGATLTLPAFDKAVVQIDVVGTSGASTGVLQNIYVGDEEVSTETTGAKDVTNEYAIASEYQAAGNVYVLKVTSAHNTQISKIVVHFAGTGTYTEKATLNASGYATYATKYPLDFSAAADYTAWTVSEINGTTITFEQVTDAVKGGVGVLLKGEANASVTLASADSDEEPANLLQGTLVPTYVAAGEFYGLKADAFQAINAGVVPAGKAILPVPANSVKALTFVFNGVDGIQTIETVSAEQAAQIFDLAGRRIAQPRKGVNIVNGKKVLVK